MREQIEQLKLNLKEELALVNDLQELDNIRVKYLGKRLSAHLSTNSSRKLQTASQTKSRS